MPRIYTIIVLAIGAWALFLWLGWVIVTWLVPG